MKTLLILLAIALLLIGCERQPEAPIIRYEIEMTRVDGKIINGTYFLPQNAAFYINSYRGSYYLVWHTKELEQNIIKHAIIDYRIISKGKP